MNPVTIVLVDDHRLLRHALREVIEKHAAFRVVLEADHGRDLIDRLSSLPQVPDLVLLDINMPHMNGYDTALWLKNNHPKIKVMALTMYDNEAAIIRMLKNGARGYVLKDAEQEQLYEAMERINVTGFYYSDLVVGALSNSLLHAPNGTYQHPAGLITEREMEFVQWACTEMTYKEIADEMCLSPRTIDGYREALFEKLSVRSRVGLVLYALRNGLLDG